MTQPTESRTPLPENMTVPEACETCEHWPFAAAASCGEPCEPAPGGDVPEVRRVALLSPLTWLRHGWRDMWRQPLSSIGFGLVLVLIGVAILEITAEFPYLYTAAVSGFLLVAPMLGAGLYEKSRRYLSGEPVPAIALGLAWRRNASALLGFSLLCFLAGTLWQVISVFVIAVFYKGGGLKPVDMIIEILRNPEHNLVFAMYVGMGAVFAAVVFALTVVSAPMLVDRSECRLMCALGTSINAVAENPLPLALWATTIMVMVAVGFLTAMLGLIVVLPWLAHASFHAYRALVE